MKIRCGIIGLGKIGLIRALEIDKNENLELVKVYDIHLPEGKFSDYRVNSIDEMFENVDALFICAYNNVLAPYTLRAIKNGIHVFCEKPPARTVNELNEVKSALKINPNVILKYGFNHRYHYSILEAKKIIEKGKMGSLLWVKGLYGKAGSIDYDQNWRSFKNIAGGGILMDQGIHIVDLLHHLTGLEYEVKSSIVETLFWKIECEDNVFAQLKSKNSNVIATIHSSATHWRHKFLFELCFEDGYIILDGILSSTRSYAPEILKIGMRELEDITFAMGKPQEKTIWFENDDSWKMEVDEFTSSILTGNPIQNGTIEDAIRTLECVESIYEKSR